MIAGEDGDLRTTCLLSYLGVYVVVRGLKVSLDRGSIVPYLLVLLLRDQGIQTPTIDLYTKRTSTGPERKGQYTRPTEINKGIICNKWYIVIEPKKKARHKEIRPNSSNSAHIQYIHPY